MSPTHLSAVPSAEALYIRTIYEPRWNDLDAKRAARAFTGLQAFADAAALPLHFETKDIRDINDLYVAWRDYRSPKIRIEHVSYNSPLEILGYISAGSAGSLSLMTLLAAIVTLRDRIWESKLKRAETRYKLEIIDREHRELLIKPPAEGVKPLLLEEIERIEALVQDASFKTLDIEIR